MQSTENGFRGPVDGQQTPRFAGIKTFMRLPAGELPADARVAILGVPFDTASSYRTGSRFGPEAVRSISSLLRPFHPVHRVDLAAVPAADVGDAPVVPGNVVETARRVQAFLEPLVATGAVPLVIGGDHSITLASLRALRARHGRLSLVQFDSHGDTWDEYFGERYTHGTTFRRAVEEDLIDPRASIQVGLRGSLYQERDAALSTDLGFEVLPARELLALDVEAFRARVAARVGENPLFVSFDIDFVDPSCAPATGTPEVGGPTSAHALELLRALAGLRLAGADCVEISPAYDGPGQITALLGATVVWELMALAALRAGVPTTADVS
ncbi:MAG: agmatinase [Actinobacteria bacterium]|nr:agmatinase [Actinomycetota bacterium]